MVIILLADSHCHLDFFPEPRKVVERAARVGVLSILSNSTSRDSMGTNLALAKELPGVRCAIGIHPENVLRMEQGELEAAFAEVDGNAALASAIGEVGLDFKYAETTGQRELQENSFRRFVEMAKSHGKPIVVHSRQAETRCLDILEEAGATKVQMHWLTTNAKTAERAVSLGYAISCGPSIMSGRASAGIVEAIPLESLLLETDAPVRFGGAESEPSWVERVCGRVAELKGTTFDDVAVSTYRNFSRLFG